MENNILVIGIAGGTGANNAKLTDVNRGCANFIHGQGTDW